MRMPETFLSEEDGVDWEIIGKAKMYGVKKGRAVCTRWTESEFFRIC